MYFLKVLARSWLDSLYFFLPKNLVYNFYFLWRGLRELFFSLKYLVIYGLIFAITVFLLLNFTPMFLLQILDLIIYFILFIGLLFFTIWLCSAYRPSIDIKNHSYFINQFYVFYILLPLFFILLFFILLFPLGQFYQIDLIFIIFLVISYIPLLIKYLNKKILLQYLILHILFSLSLIMILNISTLIIRFFDIYIFNFTVEDVIRRFFLVYNFLFPYDIISRFFFVSSPFIIFLILFLLDSQRNGIAQLKALGRSFLMYLYNLPFCVLLWLIFNFIIFLIWRLWRLIFLVFHISAFCSLELFIWLVTILTIFPIYVCFLTNYYIKQIHDNFSLYYKR